MVGHGYLLEGGVGWNLGIGKWRVVCCEMLSVSWAPKDMASSSIRDKDMGVECPEDFFLSFFFGLIELLI